MYGGIKFFERREIKDALAYLRLISQGDDLSFLRIVNTPKRMIGKERIAFIKHQSEASGDTYYETLKRTVDSPLFEKTQASEFISVIEECKSKLNKMSVSDLLQYVLESTGYENYIREDGDQDRLDNLSELAASIVNYEQNAGEELSLEDYLRQMALYTETDREQPRDTVKLMTIHISKGLEFPVVFLCGMTEGVFPSKRSLEERKQRALEEERRIAYVAITRAMNELYITESEGVGNYGIKKYPSRFIFDIMDGLYDRIGQIDSDLLNEATEYIENSNRHVNEPHLSVKTNDDPNDNNSTFKTGELITHPVFGNGIIEKVNLDTYTVKFELGSSRSISHSFQGLKHI